MQCFLHKQKIHLTKLWKVEVISFLWRVWDFVLFAICFIYYFNFFELFFGFVLIFLCGWGVFCFCFFLGGGGVDFFGGWGFILFVWVLWGDAFYKLYFTLQRGVTYILL